MKDIIKRARKIFEETFRQSIAKGESLESSFRLAEIAFDEAINGKQDEAQDETQDVQAQGVQAQGVQAQGVQGVQAQSA
jgi:hypothetical protein